MDEQNLKSGADRLLYEFGLLERLNEIGRAHIIGSYRMDMMAWHDLDIDIENGAMTREKLYELTGFILETFRPSWYEAKEVIDDKGKCVWFHGFETDCCGELWNVDLWFLDKETCEGAAAFCDDISARADEEMRKSIGDIKRALIESGEYCFEKFTSMDVYSAVLDHGVTDIEGFLKLHNKARKKHPYE